MKYDITVSLTLDPSKGEDCWAYSVNINGGCHRIGYGKGLADAGRLAKNGVSTAITYLKAEEKKRGHR